MGTSVRPRPHRASPPDPPQAAHGTLEGFPGARLPHARPRGFLIAPRGRVGAAPSFRIPSRLLRVLLSGHLHASGQPHRPTSSACRGVLGRGHPHCNTWPRTRDTARVWPRGSRNPAQRLRPMRPVHPGALRVHRAWSVHSHDTPVSGSNWGGAGSSPSKPGCCWGGEGTPGLRQGPAALASLGAHPPEGRGTGRTVSSALTPRAGGSAQRDAGRPQTSLLGTR